MVKVIYFEDKLLIIQVAKMLRINGSHVVKNGNKYKR
jgi:hypothetical protein